MVVKKIEESESMESQYEEVKNEVDFLRLENSVYRRYLEKKKAETIVDEEEKDGNHRKAARGD